MDKNENGEQNLPQSQRTGQNESAEITKYNEFDATLTTEALSNVAKKVCDVGINIAEIYRDVHVLDVQFNTYCANLDFQLDKYKTSAPIVREQLNKINGMMDKILDTVLNLDTDDDQKLDFKLKLLDTLNNYSDKISTLMIKLL